MTAAPVLAVERVRRMRGGSQSQLMRCSDGEYYVVKFQNNPQGVRILANELLATALAGRLRLPIVHASVVIVSEDLTAYSDEMFVELGRGRIPLRPGLCFGSRYQRGEEKVNDQAFAAAYDCLPQHKLVRVENVSDFAGMLVFDKWTGNMDSRQAIFVQNRCKYRALMIDNGLCFGGFRWDFSDCAAHGLYFPPVVYRNIRGFEAFELWLDRLVREIDATVLSDAAQGIPSEWYGGDTNALSTLLDQLDRRRKTVANELWKVHRRFPQLFPAWRTN